MWAEDPDIEVRAGKRARAKGKESLPAGRVQASFAEKATAKLRAEKEKESGEVNLSESQIRLIIGLH